MDRRNFVRVGLGSIAVVGVAPAALATPANPRAAWDVAMAQYVKAREAAAAYHTGTYNPVYARYKQWADQHVGEFPGGHHNGNAAAEWKARSDQNPHTTAYGFVDEEYERLIDIESDAQGGLMETPAPDRKALLYKLDYLLDSSGTESTDSFTAEFVAQTVADYRRLLGDA